MPRMQSDDATFKFKFQSFHSTLKTSKFEINSFHSGYGPCFRTEINIKSFHSGYGPCPDHASNDLIRWKLCLQVEFVDQPKNPSMRRVAECPPQQSFDRPVGCLHQPKNPSMRRLAECPPQLSFDRSVGCLHQPKNPSMRRAAECPLVSTEYKGRGRPEGGVNQRRIW